MERRLIRHGFILIAAALLSGFVIPAARIPRLALSAHTIGVMSGMLLIVVALVWQRFSLSDRQRRTKYWAWICSSYINWLAILIGALAGTGKMTPVASAGMVGSPIAEAAVAVMLATVAITSLLAVGLALWGLRADNVVSE
jgi:hydroxylaminobenzene mutase